MGRLWPVAARDVSGRKEVAFKAWWPCAILRREEGPMERQRPTKRALAPRCSLLGSPKATQVSSALAAALGAQLRAGRLLTRF